MGQLAIDGGSPFRTEPFPKWPIINEDYKTALIHTLENDEWGIDAKSITDFEQNFAQYCGAKHAVACTNGTDAIYIALQALGVGAGDEVIIPPYTFIATGIAVLMVNAIPVFADLDPGTYNISAQSIKEKITPQTKAIIPVHIAGNPADMDNIMAIAKEHNLVVIEDTAQAPGAEWKGHKTGTIGHVGTYSFQSSKNLASGEGGSTVSNDDAIAARLRTFTNCGRVEGGAWYDHHELAGNHRLGAFQAAILNVGLTQLEEQMITREGNACYLSEQLQKIGLGLQTTYEGTTRHANHLGIILYDPAKFGGVPKAKFVEALEKEGIDCANGYLPLYRYELFKSFPKKIPAYDAIYKGKVDYSKVQCQECERMCDNEGVWIFQEMLLGTQEDMDSIVGAIKKIQVHHQELM